MNCRVIMGYSTSRLLAFWQLVTLLFLLVLSSDAEVYSSASDMREIFKMEMDLAQILQTYSETLQKKIDRIDSYMAVIVLVSTAISALKRCFSTPLIFFRVTGVP